MLSFKQTDPEYISPTSPQYDSFQFQESQSEQHFQQINLHSSSFTPTNSEKVKKMVTQEYIEDINQGQTSAIKKNIQSQNCFNQQTLIKQQTLTNDSGVNFQSVNHSVKAHKQQVSLDKTLQYQTQIPTKQQTAQNTQAEKNSTKMLSSQIGKTNSENNNSISQLKSQIQQTQKQNSTLKTHSLISKTSKSIQKRKKIGFKPKRTWCGGQKDDGHCHFQYLSESQRYLIPGDIVIHLDWFQDKTGFIANYDADEKPAIRIEYDKIHETIEMQLANNQPQLQCYDYLSRFLRSLEDPDAYDMSEKIMQHGANMRRIQIFNRKLYEQYRINFDERNDKFYHKAKQILIENYVSSICLFQIILTNPQTLLPERMFDGVTKSCAQLFFGETFGGNVTEYILRQGNLELFNHRMKISQKEFQMYNLNSNTKIQHNLSSNMYTSDNITFPVNIDYIIHPLDGDDQYRIREDMTNHHFLIVTRINIHPEVEENFIHLRASIPPEEKIKSLKIKNLQYKIQSNMFIERFYPDLSRQNKAKIQNTSSTNNCNSNINNTLNNGIQYGNGIGNPSLSEVKIINQKAKFQVIQIPLNDSISTEL
ncbi:hypothetical protein ABPG74_013810 [Tetrahymena malaccensis]